MTVKQRLIDYIKFKNISVNRFEKACGLSTGYVGNMRVSIQPDKIKIIALNFPDLNTGWLLTGEGEMLKNTNSDLARPSAVSLIPDNKAVPLYDFQTARDLMSGKVPSTMDYLYIPSLTNCDGALYVRTNSMAPRIQTGDIVLFKMLHTNDGSYTADRIRWGDIYLILFSINGDSSVVLKHIQKTNDENIVKLANYDKTVDPYEIPLNTIKSLALVKGGAFYTTMD